MKPSQLLQHLVLHVKDIVHDRQKDKEELQNENIRLKRDMADFRHEPESLHRRCRKQNALIKDYEQNIIMKRQMDQQREDLFGLSENVNRLNSAPVAKPFVVHYSDFTHFEGNIHSLQNSFDALACQMNSLNLKVEESTETIGSCNGPVY